MRLLGGLKHQKLPANASSHVNKDGIDACVAEVVGFFERRVPLDQAGVWQEGRVRYRRRS